VIIVIVVCIWYVTSLKGMGTEKYKFGIQLFPCLKTFQLILNFKEGIKEAKGVNFRNRSFGSC
jgi:hypothetical protein